MKNTLVHDSQFTIRQFEMRDYDPILSLWRSVKGLSLGESDSPENVERYLLRNPGLSFTAWRGDRSVSPRGMLDIIRSEVWKDCVGRFLTTVCEALPQDRSELLWVEHLEQRTL